MPQGLTVVFPILYLLLHTNENTDSPRKADMVTEKSDYSVIWSVPFQSCVKTGSRTGQALKEAGVLVNDGYSFQGDKITTFYTLGLYPYIGPQGDVNGGVPQLADLNAHLQQAERDIEKIILDPDYTGLVLIDWESWRPVWEFNFGALTVYQKRSVDLVRQEHPDWPMSKLLAEATQQWETAAREFMESTLQLAKNLRPKAQWCFYGFPDCYNYNGQFTPETYFCSGNIMQGNDKLQWLWDQSPALCPSVYLRKNQMLSYNLTERSWYTYGRLQEALRVGGYAKPIYPYINYYMFDARKTVPEVDFARLMSEPLSLGMSGVVIWGSSKNVRNKTDCEVIDQYVNKVIVPTMSILHNQSHSCIEQFCHNSKGSRCMWTKPTAYEAWKMLVTEESEFDTRGLVCINPVSQTSSEKTIRFKK